MVRVFIGSLMSIKPINLWGVISIWWITLFYLFMFVFLDLDFCLIIIITKNKDIIRIFILNLLILESIG